jgi:hypothetical protein
MVRVVRMVRRAMRDDEGTEDLSGEDMRSKAQRKGERHYEDRVAVSLERARERGRGREADAPKAIPPLVFCPGNSLTKSREFLED